MSSEYLNPIGDPTQLKKCLGDCLGRIEVSKEDVWAEVEVKWNKIKDLAEKYDVLNNKKEEVTFFIVEIQNLLNEIKLIINC